MLLLRIKHLAVPALEKEAVITTDVEKIEEAKVLRILFVFTLSGRLRVYLLGTICNISTTWN